MALTGAAFQLNSIAQGLIPLAAGEAWFEALPIEEQLSVLTVLAYFTSQSHPLASDVERAIAHAQLKPTFTPCVMVLKASKPEAGCQRLIDLPTDEWIKSFRLMVALLGIADQRRRETLCRAGCTHPWHNLSNNAH